MKEPLAAVAVTAKLLPEAELPPRFEISREFFERFLRLETRVELVAHHFDELVANVTALITEPAVPVLEEAPPGHVAALGQNGILRGGARHHGPLGRKPEGTPADGEQLISAKE